VKPSAILPVRLIDPLDDERVASLSALARVRVADEIPADVEPLITFTRAGTSLGMLPDEHVDVDAAEKRAAAERERIEGEIKRVEGKLSNEQFVSRAPANVVRVERDKLAALQEQLAAL
jgi:valyl-tRNA synthetase